MKKKTKTINKRNWKFLIPQFAVFFALALILKELNVSGYWLLSLSIYLLLNGYLKIVIPHSHRKGLYYLRKGEFEGAKYSFEKSYSFFQKHLWLDQYRAFTMLSLSGYSYREMALMNIIFCYSKLGDIKEAKKVKKRLSIEFPENEYGK